MSTAVSAHSRIRRAPALRHGKLRAAAAPTEPSTLSAGVTTRNWQWEGHNIRYQEAGTSGPAVLLVHGFGANADHWRKNTPVIGTWGRAYAIDLLGYGYSDKPDPTLQPPNTIYTFDNWADQLEVFVDEVVQQPVVVVANSVGGLAALQLAVQAPSKVKGVQILNISLRQLHESKQNRVVRPLVSAFQRVLRDTSLGVSFFESVATRKSVAGILKQAYSDEAAVTDELVDCILKPGLQPGAAKVFLDFISYSSGPLPEDLMASCPVPLSVLWGTEDPWEKVEWGRELAKISTVSEYIELDGVGHCPQDESPDRVNPLIQTFTELHS